MTVFLADEEKTTVGVVVFMVGGEGIDEEAMALVRRPSSHEQQVRLSIAETAQDLGVRLQGIEAVDVMERRHHGAAFGIGAGVEQFALIVRRIGQVKIALRPRQLAQLVAAQLADAHLVAGEAGEESARRDVVIFHDAPTRRPPQQLDTRRPADGVVIEQDRARIIAEEIRQLSHVPRLRSLLDPMGVEQPYRVALRGQDTVHLQGVVAHGVAGGNAQADDGNSAHALHSGKSSEF